jgi:hypothetical protein
MSFAARLADSSASVTPEVKMGSKNSLAFPVTAQPGPWKRVTAADQPSSRAAFITGTAFAMRSATLGSMAMRWLTGEVSARVPAQLPDRLRARARQNSGETASRRS